MTAVQFFAILTPVVGLFFFSVICLFAYTVRPEDGPPAPKAPRPLTKTCVLIRSAFVYAAGLLALHRAWAVYMILALEYSRDPGAMGSIGMGLMVFDPWGILLTLGPVITIDWFTGVQLVSDRMLPAFYMLFSTIIDGILIRLLWTRARRAFVRPPEEKKPPENQSPAANN
ncbi:MAG TPA: hypothetical protein DDW67_10075 [Elusimicrobia bacterium]|jgi:hypothetical protein|nr:hypothetical protein [Elusimicrobiota bacterium]